MKIGKNYVFIFIIQEKCLCFFPKEQLNGLVKELPFRETQIGFCVKALAILFF